MKSTAQPAPRDLACYPPTLVVPYLRLLLGREPNPMEVEQALGYVPAYGPPLPPKRAA